MGVMGIKDIVLDCLLGIILARIHCKIRLFW
jgi:hypothetical protein